MQNAFENNKLNPLGYPELNQRIPKPQTSTKTKADRHSMPKHKGDECAFDGCKYKPRLPETLR